MAPIPAAVLDPGSGARLSAFICCGPRSGPQNGTHPGDRGCQGATHSCATTCREIFFLVDSTCLLHASRWVHHALMGAHLVCPILGPENDPTFGAHFRTDLNRFSSPTTKHKSSWGENLGVGNHSSGGGSPHRSSRRSYKIVGGKANPCSLGKNTLPLR